MNCCNANGQCDQGKDCPIRKQRIKEINDAYANRIWLEKEERSWTNSSENDFVTFSELIAFIVLIGGSALIYFVIWGQL